MAIQNTPKNFQLFNAYQSKNVVVEIPGASATNNYCIQLPTTVSLLAGDAITIGNQSNTATTAGGYLDIYRIGN